MAPQVGWGWRAISAVAPWVLLALGFAVGAQLYVASFGNFPPLRYGAVGGITLETGTTKIGSFRVDADNEELKVRPTTTGTAGFEWSLIVPVDFSVRLEPLDSQDLKWANYRLDGPTLGGPSSERVARYVVTCSDPSNALAIESRIPGVIAGTSQNQVRVGPYSAQDELRHFPTVDVRPQIGPIRTNQVSFAVDLPGLSAHRVAGAGEVKTLPLDVEVELDSSRAAPSVGSPGMVRTPYGLEWQSTSGGVAAAARGTLAQTFPAQMAQLGVALFGSTLIGHLLARSTAATARQARAARLKGMAVCVRNLLKRG